MALNWIKASAGTSLALAAVALGGYAYTRAHAEPTYRFANGVEVTPLEVQTDDTRTLLDAKIWKFDVNLPDTNKLYNYTLDLCSHGKIVAPLGGLGVGPYHESPHHTELTVGVVPTDTTFGHAPQVKYNIKASSGGTSGTFANPFRKCIGYSDTPQFSRGNDFIYLMSGSGRGAVYGLAEEDDTSLVLRVEPLTQTPKPAK